MEKIKFICSMQQLAGRQPAAISALFTSAFRDLSLITSICAFSCCMQTCSKHPLSTVHITTS